VCTVLVGLNASWPSDRVSPRLVLRTDRVETAALIAGSEVAGTDLSTSTDTVCEVTAPGATTVWVIVLLARRVVLLVAFL